MDVIAIAIALQVSLTVPIQGPGIDIPLNTVDRMTTENKGKALQRKLAHDEPPLHSPAEPTGESSRQEGRTIN